MPDTPCRRLAQRLRESETNASDHRVPELDPIVGLEVIRRTLGVSKATFYGGIVATLPVITLSARRRGVRRSDLENWLSARTRRTADDNHWVAEV